MEPFCPGNFGLSCMLVRSPLDSQPAARCVFPQEPQREQLQALLDNIYGDFVATVAGARGKTEAEVEAMLDEGIYGLSPLHTRAGSGAVNAWCRHPCS